MGTPPRSHDGRHTRDIPQVRKVYRSNIGLRAPNCGYVWVTEDLAALHPTPAVCGTPEAETRRLISTLEPVERGFYSGLVGWCDSTGDVPEVVARHQRRGSAAQAGQHCERSALASLRPDGVSANWTSAPIGRPPEVVPHAACRNGMCVKPDQAHSPLAKGRRSSRRRSVVLGVNPSP
ncbi:chorismate-binding protein [Nonomuraea sp. NPDC026600]|uniref:chorismate-binding protein n=1 Tax=Nonomuraea sp. NPDC026600 TaxID=3155363 RepID=UPI0033C58487